MNYFITGATGFLGGRLTEILLEKGEKVIAVGRNEEEGARLASLGAVFLKLDLSDINDILEKMPEGSVVIHCAALSSAWGKESEFFDANVLGTQIMAYAALQKNAKRFIHISTPSLYLEKKSKENIGEEETLPKKMSNLYTKTKLRSEEIIREHHELGLKAIILRPQGIFGPRDASTIPKLLKTAKRGFIPVMNDRLKVDMTYVDNVVEAILCAVNAPENCNGQTYHITNDEPVDRTATVEKLLNDLGYPVKRRYISVDQAWKVASAMEWAYRTFKIKGEPMITKHHVCSLGYTRTLSVEKAKRELGYRPKVSVQQGLELTKEWFIRSTRS